jgi:stage V sporulation protein B
MSTEDKSQDESRAAGRGGIAVLGAKLYFIVTGFIQQPLLNLAIGAADYGALSRVLAVSNVVNNVVVASSTQGVSRTVAAAGEQHRQALRATLRVHAVIAIVAGALLAVASPLVARFQHASEVMVPLVVMSGVLFIYGFYAPLVGYLNGRRQFTRQATLDVVAATLRTAGFIGLGALFTMKGRAMAASIGTTPGVLGATVGAALASAGVFSLALRWTGTGASGEGGPPVRAYLALIAPVMVSQFFTNALMQADMIMLGRYLSLGAIASGIAEPAERANEWVTAYRATQLFAFLPYQLLFSVTQILFPLVAKAKAEEPPPGETREGRIAELVSRGCRVGAIFAGALVCIVLALPESLVALAYGTEVAGRAAPALRILVLGQAAFAMLGLAATVLVSLGREKTAMAINAFALALLVSACAGVVPTATFGGAQLIATAAATSSALAVALAFGIWRVRAAAGAFVPWKTAVRVAVCAILAWVVDGLLPVLSKPATILAAALVGVVYLAALVAMRELGKEDLTFLLSLARRRSARS